MRRFKVRTLLGVVAVLAFGITLFMPMTSWKAARFAKSHLQESIPSIDLNRYETVPFRRGRTGTWYVDFREKDRPGGILVIIDYPDDVFPGPDVGYIEYASRSPQGLVPEPGHESVWEDVKARDRQQGIR